MIEISLARRADAGLLHDVERSGDQAFRGVPELAWLAEDDSASPTEHADMIGWGFSWIARSGPEIVGFLIAQPHDSALHIWQMSVRTRCQKQGIGRQLVQTAQRAAAQAGLREITLTTFRDLKWNEMFYASCGFNRLESSQISSFLKGVLTKEVEAGLPPDMRCAMLCRLGPS